jgi:hypothetical protein
VSTDALACAHRLTEELRELRKEHEQVIAAARRLLAELAGTLAGCAPAATSPASVAAGPFADAAALRRFAEGIQRLPGVSGVEVREFVGGDRAVLDVHLDGPTA